MKAFILAAGLGTRLKPITNTKPKALVEVAGRSMLEWNLERLIDFGIREIVINTHHFPEQIQAFVQEYIRDKPELNIECVHEKDLLETGGAIKNVEFFLFGDDFFLVHNVDIMHDIDLNKMITLFDPRKYLAMLACKQQPTTRPWLVDEENIICGHRNKIEKSEKILREPAGQLREMRFCGIHVVANFIFKDLESGSYSITPKYLELIDKGLVIKAFDAGDSYYFDLGTEEKIDQVNNFLGS